MVKVAGETGVVMILDLVNQIIVEGVIPVERKLSTIKNCYKGKEYSIEKKETIRDCNQQIRF